MLQDEKLDFQGNSTAGQSEGTPQRRPAFPA
jgi:hypothetical protein